MTKAILDACFVIDWLRYSRYELLFKLFDLAIITLDVLNEIKMENTLVKLSKLIEEEKIVIIDVEDEVKAYARELVIKTREIPHVPSLDYAEAICLALAKKVGYVVLTENKAALYAPKFLDELEDVKVMNSLYVLIELYKRGVLTCEELKREVKRYMRETLHVFPKRELRRVEACEVDRGA